MTIIKSPSTDPAVNFALERELLNGREGDFLLLYINSPCVVIGRNQAEAAEADLDLCAREGIPVIRRISGGGTVWHDGGNVNFAFITAADGKSPLDDKPLEPVIAALHAMGVEAVAGSRGELLVGGKKISGTASCVRRGRRLFHGTLLFDADLDAMRRALAGDRAARGRKVSSVPSVTVNLRPLLGGFDTAPQFLEGLAAELARYLT
jgi:lipoate-protein ligase A